MNKLSFKIKSVLLILIVLLFSSCASILNPKYQKVTIEHPEESKVLIDGYEPDLKKGKYLCRRDGEAKQITIQKSGYKDENIAIMQNHKSPLYILSIVPFTAALFLPPFYDNLLKSRNYIYNVPFSKELIPLPNKSNFNKLISVNSLDINIQKDSIKSTDFIKYGKYIKGNFESKKEVIGDKDEQIELMEIDPSLIISEGLIDKGYIVQNETSKEIQISAKLTSINTQYIASYRDQSWTTYPFFGKMLRLQVGIEWSISNKNGETSKFFTASKSGEFAYLKYGDSSRLASKRNALKDAFENGFISLTKSIQFKNELQKINPNYIDASIAVTENDSIVKINSNIITIEKRGYDMYLIKNDKKVKVNKELGIGRMNSSTILEFVKDQPEIYEFAKENIHKGFGFISSLISCYNDFQQNPIAKVDQTYFNKFGLITKKEWKHGPSEEILKEKKFIYGEIRQVIVTTQHYSNGMPTTSTTADNFKVSFSYGNAEYKSGFLMKNLKAAFQDDKEAVAYIKKYRNKFIRRGVFASLGLSFFVTAGLAANDSKPFGLSDDATPFIAIPGVLLYTVFAGLDRTYKSEYIEKAITIYNNNVKVK